jgi:RHS repeat-associated protein
MYLIGKRHGRRLAARLFAATALLSLAISAHAEVKLPNGEWIESVEDLRVKVPGGYVVAQRTWQADRVNRGEYRWHLNPAWDDLRFDSSDQGDAIDTVLRAGAKFERTGDSEPIYVFDDQFFIREQLDGAGQRTGWRWYDRQGNWITYDAQGLITAYGDRNNIQVSFTRDADQRLHQVIDHHGTVVLTYSYTGGNTTVTDRAGRSVEYRYTNGNLTEVIDVLGNPWRYAYSGGLMTGMTDAENRETTITYSGNRVVAVAHPPENGRDPTTRYEYDYDRVKRQYTIVEYSPENRRVQRVYDAKGKLIRQDTGSRTTYRLERDGTHIEHRIDERGMRTTTEYDANRNPVRIRHPDGTEERMAYEPRFNQLTEEIDELGVKTAYEYDAAGNLLKQTEAVGLPEQRITTFTYSPAGERLTRTIKGSTPAEDATTTWTYDTLGNLATETNAEEETTTFGDYHVTGQPGSRVNALHHATLFTYDDAGRLLTTTNPLGHQVTYGYDKLGNRTLVRDPLLNETTYAYTARNWLKSITEPLDAVTRYEYDDDGNRTKEIDPEGVEVRTEYDLDGRLWKTIDAADNTIEYVYGTQQTGPAGLLYRIKFPTYAEEYGYDQRGRLIQEVRLIPPSDGTPEKRQVVVTSFNQRGQRSSRTDALGRTTIYSYNGLGNLIEENSASGSRAIAEYDTRGNIILLTAPGGVEYEFRYDKVDRLISEKRASNGVILYSYNGRSMPWLRENARGDRRVYTYDELDRRTEERIYAVGNAEPAQLITYSYDPRGLLTGYKQSGDTVSAAIYGYDVRGERISEVVTYGAGTTAITKTISYDFYKNRKLRSTEYPDGTEVHYSYDLAGRPLLIASRWGTIEFSNYDWYQPKYVTLPGAVRTQTFDPLQRLESVQVQALGDGTYEEPSGPVELNLDYRFDDESNVLRKVATEGEYQYQYDLANRLTMVVPPNSILRTVANPGGLPSEQYAYDTAGNRNYSEHQPGAWVYESDQLISFGSGPNSVTFSYDVNGNVESESTNAMSLEYAYNPAERMTEVKRDGALVASYEYDPFGRRIKKIVSGVSTWFQYTSEGLAAEFDELGGILRTYHWSPGNTWGSAPLLQNNCQAQVCDDPHFYHNDHLGAPLLATDSNGTVSWRAYYEAFGRRILNQSNRITSHLGLPGQFHDDETGLQYNLFRYYNADIGRYYQADPIGILGGDNLYSYADSDPLNSIDPEGLGKLIPRPPNPRKTPQVNPPSGPRRIDPEDWLDAPMPQPPPPAPTACTMANLVAPICPPKLVCREWACYRFPRPNELSCKRRDEPPFYSSNDRQMRRLGYRAADDPNCRCVRFRWEDR